VTEQPIDTSTATGKCFLEMVGVFAAFETNLREERPLEGIAKAKRPTSSLQCGLEILLGRHSALVPRRKLKPDPTQRALPAAAFSAPRPRAFAPLSARLPICILWTILDRGNGPARGEAYYA
jgi:Resolvase, N terminal domain